MANRLQFVASEALRECGFEATREAVNFVTASMAGEGVTSHSDNERLVSAATRAMAAFGSKFKGVDLAAALRGSNRSATAKTEPSGQSCPRCGMPMVVASVMNRKVSYCMGDCHIALPFKPGEEPA